MSRTDAKHKAGQAAMFHPCPATWRVLLAAILGFITAFFVFGYLFALASGGVTPVGFQINGGPALLAFALMVAYFVIDRRWLGGTRWQRILRAR